MLAFAVVLLAQLDPVASPVAIATPRPPSVVAVGLGLERRDAQGPSGTELNPFVYPNVALTAEGDLGVVEVSSPLPVMIPDGIGAAIDFLSGGPGDIPLWTALNGKDEPCAVTFFDAGARLGVALADRVRFEAGARTYLRFGGVLVPEEDERIGIQPFALLSTFGVRGGQTDGVNARLVLHAGNSWTRFATWNPVVGGDLRVSLPVTGNFAIDVLGGWQAQRLDLRPYREPLTQEQVAGAGWYTFGSAEIRAVYRWTENGL